MYIYGHVGNIIGCGVSVHVQFNFCVCMSVWCLLRRIPHVYMDRLANTLVPPMFLFTHTHTHTHTHSQTHTLTNTHSTWYVCTLNTCLPALGTQSTNLHNETTAGGKTTMSVTGDTSMGRDNGALPLALILGCSLVGVSSLILIVMLIFIIAACVGRRKSYVVNKVSGRSTNSNSSKQQVTHYDPEAGSRRPVYAQVYKNRDLPPEPVTPVRLASTSHAPSPPTEDSVLSNGTSTGNIVTEPQPRELLAYSSVPRHGFRPFPPPPRIASWLNQSDLGGSNWETSSFQASLHGPIDTYDGASDVSSVLSSVRPSERHNWQNTWHPSESYYDRPEALQEDVMSSLNSSILPLTMSLNQAHLDLPEGHYQVPNSRPATLPRRNENKKSKNDQTFKERLEPSMFQALSASIDQSTQALPYAPIYDSPRSLKRSEEPLEISRQNIVEIQDLGVGHFGRVVLAATTKLSLKELRLGESTDKSCSVLVAIKKLRQDADMSLKEAFQSEIKFMSKLKHANVVRLLGVCTDEGADESFLMMEYMENGDLHEFLQKQILVADTVEKLEDNRITPLILLYMTVQIASGMRYLASKKFVHRDLATRNCLVGRDFVVKISDFGMSRNLYESFYYRVQGRLILPIRWMAYESFYGKFSVKSDAWSFGVTIWEIYTLGQSEPYEDMTDEEYINDAVKGGERKILSQPNNCPDEVYEVMLRCFVHEPNMRADFEEIYSRLFLTYTRLGKINTK